MIFAARLTSRGGLATTPGRSASCVTVTPSAEEPDAEKALLLRGRCEIRRPGRRVGFGQPLGRLASAPTRPRLSQAIAIGDSTKPPG